jgi:hypothetical protein
MNPISLLRWQWQNYPGTHANRANLLLHIATVPLFWLGTTLLVLSVAQRSWSLPAVGAVCILAALMAQGRGHKLEQVPPAPFTGPANFVGRFVLEQWITFPRFVLSGAWRRNLRAAD